MTTVESLKREIDEIKKRNRLVEANKAWETSLTRKVLISLFTYVVISLFMTVISVQHPWINAIVPTVGFILSTLSLPFFRWIWEQYISKHRSHL